MQTPGEREGDPAIPTKNVGDALSPVQLSLTNEIISHARQLLDQAGSSQDRLAAERGKVLVERIKVKDSGKFVQNQRSQTRDAEVVFVNLLRQFLNERSETFPPLILSAYEKVQAEHDKLGQAEEEYHDAERSLSGLEWSFMDQENMFYQFELQDFFEGNFLGRLSQPEVSTVPPPPPPPPPPPLPFQFIRPPPDVLPTGLDYSGEVELEYKETVSELGRLRRAFDSLRPEQSRYLEDRKDKNSVYTISESDPINTSHFGHTYSELLGQIALCEVRAQQLKHQSMQHANSTKLVDRRNSHPNDWSNIPLLSHTAMTRARTESAFPALLNDPDTKHRVREWLREYAKTNTIEKTLYANILAGWGVIPENDLLGDSVSCYWPLESSSTSVSEAQSSTSNQRTPSQHSDPEESSTTAHRFNIDRSTETEATKNLTNLRASLEGAVVDGIPGLGTEKDVQVPEIPSIQLQYMPANVLIPEISDERRRCEGNPSLIPLRPGGVDLNRDPDQPEQPQTSISPRCDGCFDLAAMEFASSSNPSAANPGPGEKSEWSLHPVMSGASATSAKGKGKKEARYGNHMSDFHQRSNAPSSDYPRPASEHIIRRKWPFFKHGRSKSVSNLFRPQCLKHDLRHHSSDVYQELLSPT